MDRLSNLPLAHTRGNLHVVNNARQSVRPSVRVAVAHGFHDLCMSVRKLRDLHRSERLAERDVEQILREFHRECSARTRVIEHLRRAA